MVSSSALLDQPEPLLRLPHPSLRHAVAACAASYCCRAMISSGTAPRCAGNPSRAVRPPPGRREDRPRRRDLCGRDPASSSRSAASAAESSARRTATSRSRSEARAAHELARSTSIPSSTRRSARRPGCAGSPPHGSPRCCRRSGRRLPPPRPSGAARKAAAASAAATAIPKTAFLRFDGSIRGMIPSTPAAGST
jgi:hypothetical protein